MEAKLFYKHQSVFNHYVTTHPHGDVLQTTYWGKLKAFTGWQMFPLAVVDNGHIQASSLMLKRSLPLPGTCIIYSPRGPLYSNIAALEQLLIAGKQLARQERAIVWKMDPALPVDDQNWNAFSKQLTEISTGSDFDGVQPKFIMDLDIRPSLDNILANMKTKTRYNIRYAKRKGVTVKLSQDKADLEQFYPILQETAERDNFTVRSYEYFAALWDHLVINNVAQLFMVYHEGEPLGGTIAFKLGKRAWYVYGASSNKKRNLMSNYAIQWEMIKWAKGCGCHTYDFRGVSGDLNPENPLYGLYRFKDGFGAQLREYVGEFDAPIIPIVYHLAQPAITLYQRLRNK